MNYKFKNVFLTDIFDNYSEDDIIEFIDTIDISSEDLLDKVDSLDIEKYLEKYSKHIYFNNLVILTSQSLIERDAIEKFSKILKSGNSANITKLTDFMETII
jgi:hypothetical protein